MTYLGPGRAWFRGRHGFVSLCFLLVGSIYLVSKAGFHLWDSYRLCALEDDWHGFGPERGHYNFTVVTALFDIGRGRWWTQGRTYKEYLGHMMQILMLDVNIVVFIEPKGADFVHRMRKGRESRTIVLIMEIKELQYAPLLHRIKEIMANKAFQKNNANYRQGKPEATDPLYDLVTNSKVSLVHRAMELSGVFGTDYFIWMDGGYGHGDSSIYPPDHIWNPQHLLVHPSRVTFIALEDLPSHQSDAHNLHKLDTAWIAGGLFAGGKAVMEEFHRLHMTVMLEYMKDGTIDDDQTTFLHCFYRNQSNFNPVLGNWYDLMEPFT